MFNVKLSELTDEEIYKRITLANQKVNSAYNVGASHQIIEQIQNVIQSYHAELAERADKASFETNRKHLEAPIESDPQFVEKPKEEQTIKPRHRIII